MMIEKKILLANFAESKSDYVKEYLSAMRYKIKFAKTQAGVLKYISTESCQIILIDTDMSVMDGFELCKNIKKKYLESVVYGFSSHIACIGVEFFEKSGFDGFLSHPVKLRILKKAIEGALDRIVRSNLQLLLPADNMLHAKRIREIL